MQIRALAAVCFAVAIIGLHAERHLVCKRLDSVLSTDEREEEMPINSDDALAGLRGEKGNAGRVGLPGPPADVDFRIVNASIDRKLKAIQRLNDRVDELTSKLEEARMRMKSKVDTDICELWFPDKCYWVYVQERFSMFLREGDAICRKKSGHLGNLYNAEEYSKIVAYLQEKIPPNMHWIAVHLGMTADPENRSVSLHNGTRATFLPWYPTYPVFKSPFTKIYLTVRSETSPRMGIQDFDPMLKARAVLCEISIAH